MGPIKRLHRKRKRQLKAVRKVSREFAKLFFKPNPLFEEILLRNGYRISVGSGTSIQTELKYNGY